MPDAGCKTHKHQYYHMFCMTKGVCSFWVEDREYALREGQCLLVPPKTDHAFGNTTGEKLEFLEVKFALPSSSFDTQLLQSGVQVADHPLAGALVEEILNEYSRVGSAADDATASYLTAVLNLFEQPKRFRTTGEAFRYVDASQYSPLSQRVIRYLEESFAQTISLDEIADEMGYNKSYLCVVFKKDTNLTIWDCLSMIRIRRAAELIVYSDHDLADVAKMSGFSSVSTFNRAFCKYVGTTPTQCRRAYPQDVLHGPASSDPNRFMYSVLAHKRITKQMIQNLDAAETNGDQ